MYRDSHYFVRGHFRTCASVRSAGNARPNAFFASAFVFFYLLVPDHILLHYGAIAT